MGKFYLRGNAEGFRSEALQVACMPPNQTPEGGTLRLLIRVLEACERDCMLLAGNGSVLWMSQGLNLGRSGLLETILEHLTGNGYPPSSNGHDKSTGTGFWIYDIAEGMGNIGRIFLVVFKRIHSGFMVWPEMQRRFGLTQRESQVAELLLVRKSNWEIAHELGISEHTAKHHTEKILAKFGVNSRRAVEAIVRKSLLPVFVSDG